MLTLARYLAANPNISWQQSGLAPNSPIEPNKAIWLYDYTPEAWRLSDYAMSSIVSGPAIVLVPRANKG